MIISLWLCSECLDFDVTMCVHKTCTICQLLYGSKILPHQNIKKPELLVCVKCRIAGLPWVWGSRWIWICGQKFPPHGSPGEMWIVLVSSHSKEFMCRPNRLILQSLICVRTNKTLSFNIHYKKRITSKKSKKTLEKW